MWFRFVSLLLEYYPTHSKVLGIEYSISTGKIIFPYSATKPLLICTWIQSTPHTLSRHDKRAKLLLLGPLRNQPCYREKSNQVESKCPTRCFLTSGFHKTTTSITHLQSWQLQICAFFLGEHYIKSHFLDLLTRWKHFTSFSKELRVEKWNNIAVTFG